MSFTLMLSSLTQNNAALAQVVAPAPKPEKAATPDDRATEFKAVEGGGETRSGTTLVVEAYVLLWLILMTWLFLVWRKQASLHARLDDLEKVLDKAAAAKPSK